ncbi:hypothetical protein cje28_01316 [Campylobacter jejuni subsp. jejuni 51037]|nr:hypothetical protein cje10_03461 [Campylobacter jejuni subsp. jejuni 51494]EIB71430.1 hypothetical protein cje28_01316 [Campylobacter jejuni subsp. jejuni 51037]
MQTFLAKFKDNYNKAKIKKFKQALKLELVWNLIVQA